MSGPNSTRWCPGSHDADLVTRTVASIKPETLATLIYTSGTTGSPKGVLLPPEQLGVPRCEHVRPRRATRRRALPMAAPVAPFGKVLRVRHYQVGFVTYVDGPVENRREPAVHPTDDHGRGAPASSGILTRRQCQGGGARCQIKIWAFKASTDIKVKQRAGQFAGPTAGARMGQIGLPRSAHWTGGRMKVMISGSAALNGDVARWFDAADRRSSRVTA